MASISETARRRKARILSETMYAESTPARGALGQAALRALGARPDTKAVPRAFPGTDIASQPKPRKRK